MRRWSLSERMIKGFTLQAMIMHDNVSPSDLRWDEVATWDEYHAWLSCLSYPSSHSSCQSLFHPKVASSSQERGEDRQRELDWLSEFFRQPILSSTIFFLKPSASRGRCFTKGREEKRQKREETPGSTREEALVLPSMIFQVKDWQSIHEEEDGEETSIKSLCHKQWQKGMTWRSRRSNCRHLLFHSCIL